MIKSSPFRLSECIRQSAEARLLHRVFQSDISCHWRANTALTVGATTSHALRVKLTTHAPGSLTDGRTFDEARGIDLTALAQAIWRIVS